ncbi:MAG: hypothetical protein HN348_24820, partial [Proteobacteria bacterium]|nr:hypothetical protein [Pseudomonadota bacterium]
EAATKALQDPLREEVGGLRELQPKNLRTFLLGALHHLRERGGLLHRELPDDFINSGGRDTYVFVRRRYLPSIGPTGRMPALLTDDARSPRFDTVNTGWYERWVDTCFGNLAPLIGSAVDVWALVLPALEKCELLGSVDGKRGKVWGIPPTALLLSSHIKRLRCKACGHWMVVAAVEEPLWSDVACISGRCAGRYTHDNDEPINYFGRLYNLGQVERVFTSEHTGLLTRTAREEVEQQFKAGPDSRRPWYPNLLSCTPTLEMGIDIGTLSTAILCSVPPTQANYLQRIGRAGRRDGNSLLLTIAQGKPHDLYFYAKPEEMVAGQVNPPGVFLNASAVLERQLAAFCLDQWNAEGVPKDAIPRLLGKVFEHLDDQGKGRFPLNWLDFVGARQDEILSRFFDLFGARINEETKAHLRGFLVGNKGDIGSLAWKVLDMLRAERKQRDSLRSQSKKVKRVHDDLGKSKAKNKDHEERSYELLGEKQALDRLIRDIEKTLTLQYLTDHGLLPNYAFPESPIRLRSVIWRRKQHITDKDKRRYETRNFDYVRPAITAISELAPENRFFAGGRRVTIDQVDVATATLETWRFCDQCAYSDRIDLADRERDCPSCGSHVWGEESQKRLLLRLTQVFANTNDRQSRIKDEQEERQPRHYNQRMLVSFRDEDRRGAWRIDAPAIPFAFEYIQRARFRDVNFGEFRDEGSKFSIAGRDEVRKGFVICRHCGKVQPRVAPKPGDPPPSPVHTLWCPARKKGPAQKDFETAVYLYREFSSEAIRLLLPLSEIGTERQLNSFLAAFQLGLRDRYGGRVDHLRTMVYSEPEG